MNVDIFTDFTKEADSYFFGLLLTDGNIATNRNTISLGLQAQDKHILDSYKEFVGHESKVSAYNKGRSYRYCFNSNIIKQRLMNQNMLPRKSKREQLPNFDWVTNRHFWRGVVDGDGSLFYTKGSLKVSLCGSKELLTGFNHFCQVNCFTKPRKLDKTKTENFFTMCFGGEEAIRIANTLYDDCVFFLIRKKNILIKANENYVEKPSNRGISLLPSGNFKVVIGFNCQKKYIGVFKTYEDALVARIEAEIKYQGKLGVHYDTNRGSPS